MSDRRFDGGTFWRRNSRFPYLIFMFLCVIFFLTGHKWTYPLTVQDEAYREAAVQAVDEGSVIRRSALIVLGCFGLLNLYSMRKIKPYIISNPIALSIIVLLCLISFSILWSESVSLSIRKLIVFYSVCLAAFAVFKRFSRQNFVMLVLGIATVFLFLGLAAELSAGTFAPLSEGYRFAGTVHPNSQGLNCGLMFIAAIAAADFRKGRRFYFFVGAIALLFLMLTKSRTAFSGAMIAAIIYESMLTKTSRKIKTWFTAVMVVLLLALLLGEGFFPKVHSAILFGRPSGESERQLAGRVPLFEECLGYFSKRPILGYGFGTFWTPERVESISMSIGWTTSATHSIYIDFGLDLGVIGLSLLLWLVISSFREARRRLRTTSDVIYGFFCAFLIVYVLNGLLESIFLDPGFFSFVSIVVFLLLGFGTRGLEGSPRPTRLERLAGGRTA